MSDLPDLTSIEGFDWDRANIQKSWERHRVAFDECEEVFFHDPVLAPDLDHSVSEERFFAYGYTARGRWLTVVFTVRGNKIRVVSARDMNRKEYKKRAQA